MQKKQVGQNKMSEEKFKRLVCSITVGAVLLLVILLSVMVYEIVKIFVIKNKINELENLSAYYTELAEEKKEMTEYASLKEYIEQEAKEWNYKYPWEN